MVQICGKVPSVCMKAKNRIFRTFDSIDNGYALIIVFVASNIVVDNRDNLHRRSINQADFQYLNPFIRKVI